MRRVLVLLPALLALQVGVSPALAWTWPADGPVLQQFSYDAASPYEGGRHRGIDIGGLPGATVVAPAAGTVSFAGSLPDVGRSLTIETPDGYSVTVVHLGALSVGRGEVVGERAPVGSIGPSGTAEVGEPYVHLGVRKTSEPEGYLDPLLFLPARTTDAPQEAGPPVESSAPVGEAGSQTAPIDPGPEPGAMAADAPAHSASTSGGEALEEPLAGAPDAGALDGDASQSQAATEETPIVEVPDPETFEPIAEASEPAPVEVLVEPVAGSPERVDAELPQPAGFADAGSPAPAVPTVAAPPTPVAMPSPPPDAKPGAGTGSGRKATAPDPGLVAVEAASVPSPPVAHSGKVVVETATTAAEVVSAAPMSAAAEKAQRPPEARAERARAIDRRSGGDPPVIGSPVPAPILEALPPPEQPGAVVARTTEHRGSRVPLLVGVFLLGAGLVAVLSWLRGGTTPASTAQRAPEGDGGHGGHTVEVEAGLDRELEAELACILAEDGESAGEIRVLVGQADR